MRQLESSAIESGRVSEAELMELAAQQVVAAIDKFIVLPADSPQQAIVLCGPGHNGGDGFVIARLLKERGWRVTAFELSHRRSALSPLVSHMRQLYRQKNPCEPMQNFLEWQNGDKRVVVVDAMFGIGLNRALKGEALGALIKALKQGRLVAVDILSGIDADSGQLHIDSAHLPSFASLPPAEMTVTFEHPKRGHVINDGHRLTGRLVVGPLGLAAEFRNISLSPSRPRLWTGEMMLTEQLQKHIDQHKYDHGHVACVSGPRGKGGAVRLAARAALRVGAGLVTVSATGEAMAEHAARLDAVMLNEAQSLPEIRHWWRDKRINALCLGPGMGVNETTRAIVLAALDLRRQTVLDADALTAFADHRHELFGRLGSHIVLTPHQGEFSRLFPYESNALQSHRDVSPIDSVRAAAERSNAVVLLKGATTIIGHPDGRIWLNVADAPWLATAGSGDVLAGLIAGLMARGFTAEMAACHGARLHTEAATKFGPGLTSEDLLDMIPIALRQFLTQGSLKDAKSFDAHECYELSSRL